MTQMALAIDASTRDVDVRMSLRRIARDCARLGGAMQAAYSHEHCHTIKQMTRSTDIFGQVPSLSEAFHQVQCLTPSAESARVLTKDTLKNCMDLFDKIGKWEVIGGTPFNAIRDIDTAISALLSLAETDDQTDDTLTV